MLVVSRGVPMASSETGEVTNSIGLRLPSALADIVKDHEAHPEKGRLLDRINAYRRGLSGQGGNGKKKRRVENNTRSTSSYLLTLQSHDSGGGVVIGGSIGIQTDGDTDIVACSGRLVSVCPKHDTLEEKNVVIVLDVPGGRRIPCLCPMRLLDKPAQQAVVMIQTGKGERIKEQDSGMMQVVSPTSVPVQRDGVNGHLLIEGARGLFGRVVDDSMMAALKAGCLRERVNASRAYYYHTLDRVYSIDKRNLRRIGCILWLSDRGIILLRASRCDIDLMVRSGRAAIESRLVWHKSLQNALQALDDAHNIDPPSTEEQLLQLSVGGDIDSMVMGQFLPCTGLKDIPNIRTRCACGFTGKNVPEVAQNLFRCRCNCQNHARKQHRGTFVLIL